jgi:predicted dehydrogenase
MKFLIAGLGSVGRRHLRNLLALGERDIVLYRTFRSTLPEDELSEFPVETDLNRALDHHPDAVIVANPTALHLEVAIPAAEAGCHLFLEKPISHNMERVDEFRQIVARRGVRVLVGFQFRFHPGLQTVRRLLQESAIVRPLSVRAVYGEYLPLMHPWEDYRLGYGARRDLGGGVVLTLCHPLDYLRWLFGEVRAVWGFVARLNELEISVEDTAEIALQFRNDLIGSVHLNYNQRPPQHNLEVVGIQGTLQWDNRDGTVRIYRAFGPTEDGRDEGVWEVYPPPVGFERNDMFLAEMRHFLEVVRGEAEPLCTLEDGIRALELALGAHASSQLGRVIDFEG